MAKVRVLSDFSTTPREMSVADYCVLELDGQGHGIGVVEHAEESARLCREALGRLLETLVDQGHLSITELTKIVNGYDRWEVTLL